VDNGATSDDQRPAPAAGGARAHADRARAGRAHADRAHADRAHADRAGGRTADWRGELADDRAGGRTADWRGELADDRAGDRVGRWTTVGRWSLEAGPAAAARVRRLVATALAGEQWSQLRPDAMLVASELTANAWLHGRPPLEARMATAHAAVRLEILDGSEAPPVMPPAGATGLTGRGIELVASVATRWGVRTHEGGKTVWAELTDAPATDASAPVLAGTGSTTRPEVAGPRVEVILGDVPTDLLLAAKSHVDGLVREFALASVGAAAGSSGPLPGRLAELLRIVTTGFAEPREALRRQALAAAAAGRGRTQLTMSLPTSAADAGEVYLAALEEIESYARAARLLTVASPPQHVAFRRWYVRSLIDVLRAAAAGRPSRPVPTFEQYLLDTLDETVLAGRAAERAARLQRVTAALAEATTPEQVAAVVVSESVTALGAAAGLLLVPGGPGEAEQVQIPGTVGYGDELLAQLRAERLDDELPAVHALRSGQAVWLESRSDCDRLYPGLSKLEPTVVAMCCLPLAVAGRVLGALRFSFDHPRLFDADERAFVEAMAAQTALALERARLFAAERRAREREVFLASAGDLLASTLEPDRILWHLTRLLVPRVATAAVAWRVSPCGPGGFGGFGGFGDSGGPGGPGGPGGLAGLAGPGDPAARLTGPNAAAGAEDAVRALADDARGPALDAARQARPLEGPGGGAGDALVIPLVIPLVVAGRAVAVVALRSASAGASPDDRDLRTELVRRATAALANALRYEHEREIAVTLQRGLLPRRLPTVAGLSFAWRYRPGSTASLVGGDWYDVLTVADGRTAFVIGDVMGHGIHAAAVMGQLRATARVYAADRAFRPGAVLAELDGAASRLEQSAMTTVALAVLDPIRGRLTTASAGHPPPLLIPPRGEARYLPVEPGPPLSVGVPDRPTADGPTGRFAADPAIERAATDRPAWGYPAARSGTSPAGIGFRRPRYPELDLSLEPGSTLLFFTDGLVEDRRRPIDDGLELLRQSAKPGRPPERLCDELLAALGRTDGHEDDLAMLAVSMTDTP